MRRLTPLLILLLGALTVPLPARAQSTPPTPPPPMGPPLGPPLHPNGLKGGPIKDL